jgi:hypothetical protein
MSMILLSKGEELLLVQFHEQGGERLGARPGDRLTEDDFRNLEAITPGVDFDGAVDALLDGHLIEKQDDGGYVLTQTGYDYLYKRTGHRVGEG